MTRAEAIEQIVSEAFLLDNEDFGAFIVDFLDIRDLKDALRRSLERHFAGDPEITQEVVNRFIETRIDRNSED